MDGHRYGSGRRLLLRLGIRQVRAETEIQRNQEEEGRRPWVGVGRPKRHSQPGARAVRPHRGVPAQLLHVHAPPPERHRGDRGRSQHRGALQEADVATPQRHGDGVP